MEELILTIFTDGGSRGNPGPAAAAFIALDNHQQLVGKGGLYLGVTTNNIAEYQAVELALNWLINGNSKNIKKVNFKLDSLLVVYQLKGVYKIKNQELNKKVIMIKLLEKQLPYLIDFSHIPRSENSLADDLVNEVLDFQTRK